MSQVRSTKRKRMEPTIQSLHTSRRINQMNAVLQNALPNYNWLEDKIKAIQQKKHDQEIATNTNLEKTSVQSNLVRFEVVFDPILGITIHRNNDLNQPKPLALKERTHEPKLKSEPTSKESYVNISNCTTPKTNDYEIIIKNVVTSFNVGCTLNLKEIAQKGQNVEFHGFPNTVTMRLRNSLAKATASIAKSGKITCFGTTSEKQAKIAARQFARLLQKLGFNTKFRNYRVTNVLGITKFPFCINLETFYKPHSYNTEIKYDQEIHPWVKYKIQEPMATLKIYHTGNIIVNASSIENIQRAVEHIYAHAKKHSENIDIPITSRQLMAKTPRAKKQPHKCDMCDYQTLYSTHLKRHKQSIHYKYQVTCYHCFKKFSSKDNLDKHTKKKHATTTLMKKLT